MASPLILGFRRCSWTTPTGGLVPKRRPLDMRQGQHGRSAADVVNEAEESVLADIIYQYGEDGRLDGIARAIVAAGLTAR